MRWCGVLFAASLCLAASSVRADESWNGPGWYVVATQYTVILWSGPYTEQDECEIAKPADNDPPGFSYSCSYLDQAPEPSS
jgi:hypothetical protein